eukprot:TRINITY_DN4041_c0_g3_i1.p1 TRINITY_DN4041_c0_g3~~TRINITY_DN4041_c0_g3_i1.p1  ORF type:complete len:283 (-),score=47.91 TRINITY_DN4041_c0_g3_i1:35-883(-)
MSKHKKISPPEKSFISEGVAQNCRNDGRGRLDYRPFFIQTGVISQANGSARVTLACTTVVVGVKAELGGPTPESPDKGIVNVHVSRWDNVGKEDDISSLRYLVQGMCSRLDRKLLCLRQGKNCWILYVDVVIFHEDGNLQDAVSMCTRAAIFDTRIPRVTIIQSQESKDDYELELNDDPNVALTLSVHEFPVTVTFTKIGENQIVDATMEEELCMSSRVIVGVNINGNICHVQKEFGSLSYLALQQVISASRKLGSTLLKQMDSQLQNQKKSVDVVPNLFFN